MIQKLFNSLNGGNFSLFLASRNFTTEELQKCKTQKKNTIVGFGLTEG